MPTLLLSVEHAAHDMYIPFLMALLPLLIKKMSLTHTQAGALVAIFNLSKLVSQPVAGFFVDRTGWLGYTVLALPVTGLVMSSIGCWSAYAAVAVAVALGNMSSSIFHPQGMALASILSTRRRGLTMGLFSASGSIGVSLGPVLALTLVGAYGLDKSYFGAVPALLLFPLLWKFGPWRTRLDVSDNRGNAIKELRAKWRPLSAVLAIGLLRSWVGSTFYSFVGVYLTDVRSWSIGPVKWALSFYLIAEGIGCLLGGFMSDRIGRRAVVVAGHLLSLPALFMLIRSDGSILWLSLALSSAFLNLCQPVLLVMAQEVCPEAVATAAGLTGTAEAIGGLLVAVSGYLADVYSLETALSISAVVLLAPALIAVVAPIKAQGDTAASCTR